MINRIVHGNIGHHEGERLENLSLKHIGLRFSSFTFKGNFSVGKIIQLRPFPFLSGHLKVKAEDMRPIFSKFLLIMTISQKD